SNVLSGRKWVEIFSILSGEKITLDNCGKTGSVGTMLVLKNNRSGHNYTINEPFLIDHTSSGGGGLRMGGTGGSSFNDRDTRKATDEEIDTFFECFDYVCGKTYMMNFIKIL
ncbi:hypothetical protein LCGC14_2277150, partial [marine sediment metagenome]